MTKGYIDEVISHDKLTMMMKEVSIIKRRDRGAVTVQTFCSEQEREKFKQKCQAEGLDMTHALRCMILAFIGES